MTSTTNTARITFRIACALLGLSLFAAPGAARAQAVTMRYVVGVDGMACPFCVFGLERELKSIAGVGDVAVSLGESHATVDVRPGAVIRPQALRAAIREAGFTPGAITMTVTGAVRMTGDALSIALGHDTSLRIVGGSALGGLRAAVGGGTTRFELTANVVKRGDADALEVSAFHAR